MIKKIMKKLPLLNDFLQFMWERKLWWFIPMVLVLLLLGVLIMFVQSSSVVPFVYVLF